jgi:predicted PurR-regulated permease PerM
MTRRVEISSKTIIFTIVLILSLGLVWRIRQLIYALFIAFIFMSALKPMVNRLERIRLPRSIAAFVVVISALVTIIFALAFMLPPILSETIDFFTSLPVILSETFPFLKGTFNPDSALQLLPNITENAFKVATGLFSNVLFVVSVIFFTFYFLLEEQFTESFLERFFDEKKARRIEMVLRKAEVRMGAWMRGELVLMTVVGLLTYLVLTALNVPFALSLAFLAGLLEIVPILGPIVSSVPAFIVASSSSLLLGGATLSMYMIIQQLENNIIVPYIMNKAVGIHPITTLIALSIGGTLGGVVGAIIAVPISLVIETVILDILES